jgi:hypothetical protein
MKVLRLFALLLCLSACQPTQKYPSSPYVGYPEEPESFLALPDLYSGRASLNQQEISFSQARNRHLLPLSENGNGLLISGAAENSESLSIYSITNFVLQKETAFTYPSLAGTQAADYTAFINEAGQGQVIVVNAVSRPPDNGSLEIRTVAVSDFKPAAEPEVIRVPGHFSNLQLGQTLVDDNGNGYLSLRVTDARVTSSSTPVSRWIFIPIRSHRVQSMQLTTPDTSRISGEIAGVWLNANQDGLLLYRQEPRHWFVRTISQGKLSYQEMDLGEVLNISNPKVDVDATGKGIIHFIQADRLHKLCSITGFKVSEPQAMPLPALPAEHYVLSSFKNDQGSVVEVPRTPLTGDTWAFKVHHIYQGKVVQSRTLTYAIDPLRIPGGGVSLSLTARGDGLFSWSTLQKGGMNGKIHLKAFEYFLPAGEDAWL